MPAGSKIFIPNRCLGYVSNHIPLQVRYIKNRKENLIVTCVGRSFHTYGITHFGLLSVSRLHPTDIRCMASDAYHVYTACETTVYAWRRGTELKHAYTGHSAPVNLILPFGAHLITVDQKNHIKVWDIKEETIFLELTFSESEFKITSMLHPSTYINKILFGSKSGSLQLWNINTAKLIYIFKGWNSEVICLEQAPAVDVVAIGLRSGQIILHNLKFDESIMEFTQDYGPVTTISFRTDGHPIMATGSPQGSIVFWNLEEKRVASQLLSAHDNDVTGMICLPNEPLMVTSSPDNSLKLWIFDMTDGGARLLRIREGHNASPAFIRFHGANGHNILSAAGDSTLRIFNTQTEQFNKSLGKAVRNKKNGKKSKIHSGPMKLPFIVEFTSETTREKEWDDIVAIHSGLSFATTWSYDKLKMGELKLKPERLKKKKAASTMITTATTVHITHCGNFVIIGYSDGYVEKFNIQSGLWRDSYGNPNAHTGPVRGVSTDNLNQIVITGGRDANIRFWKFKSKGSHFLTELQLEEAVHFFRAHQESSMLAVALEDYSILIVDIDTRIIVRKFEGHESQITDAAFSPDSRWLITSSMDCTIRTWDVPSAQLVDQFRTTSPCTSITMSPNSEILATSHVDYLGIFLWCNQTLYSNITLKSLSPNENIPNVVLPEISIAGDEYKEEQEEENEPDFISPEQINAELITLSGLASSRWLNLLNIDIIKKRNKPKEPPKLPKNPPFFLPTIPSSRFQFDLTTNEDESDESKFYISKRLLNLTNFGKSILGSCATNSFPYLIEDLKGMSPSAIEFEINSLSPDGGGSFKIMLQFLKCIDFMLKSNNNFELAEAYLSVFLKSHGKIIAAEESLRNYLGYIQNNHNASWSRLEKKFFYTLCIIQNLKSM